VNGRPRVSPTTEKAPPSGSRLEVEPAVVHCGQPMSPPSPVGAYQPARSTTRSTEPPVLRRRTAPSRPTATTTALGAVWPRRRLRLLTVGGAPGPVGYTRTSVAAEAPTPVTFRTTALAGAGTLRTPATCTSRTWPAPSRTPPSRVSATRTGSTGWNAAPESPSTNQPARSASRWVEPAWLRRVTCESAPTATTTRFGTVWPAAALRLLTVGTGPPVRVG